MLRIAASHADSWSQWGGYDIATEEQFFKVTRDRCTRFEDASGRQVKATKDGADGIIMIFLTWFGATALLLAWVAVVDCIRRNRFGVLHPRTHGARRPA